MDIPHEDIEIPEIEIEEIPDIEIFDGETKDYAEYTEEIDKELLADIPEGAEIIDG